MIPKSTVYNAPYPRSYGNEFTLFDHGKGCYIWDVEGKKYLDLGSGIAVNTLGYGREDLAKEQSTSETAAPRPTRQQSSLRGFMQRGKREKDTTRSSPLRMHSTGAQWELSPAHTTLITRMTASLLCLVSSSFHTMMWRLSRRLWTAPMLPSLWR